MLVAWEDPATALPPTDPGALLLPPRLAIARHLIEEVARERSGQAVSVATGRGLFLSGAGLPSPGPRYSMAAAASAHGAAAAMTGDEAK